MRPLAALLTLTLMPAAALADPPSGPASYRAQRVAGGKVYHVSGSGGPVVVRGDISSAYYGGKGKRRRVLRPRSRLVKLDNGPGFVVANPKHAWGTRQMVYQLNRIMALYHKRFPDDPPIVIRDLSRRRGGPLPGHVSHQEGRDVDIPVVLDRVAAVDTSTVRTINAERTWFLVRELVNTCEVDFIFLDISVQKLLYERALIEGFPREKLGLILQVPEQPSQKGETGIVVHWPKHLDHLHVRFRHRGAPLLKNAEKYCKNR